MLFIGGDIHNKWKILIDTIKSMNVENSHFFIAGDIGIGYDYNNFNAQLKFLEYWNKCLIKRNNTIYCIRGNHDDPKYFDGSVELSHIKLLSDNTLITVENKNILCIGGAVSIDRTESKSYHRHLIGMPLDQINRKLNDWWPDEKVNILFKSIEAILNRFTIDIVISHSAPNFCSPFIKGEIEKYTYDATLKSECDEERLLLTDLYNLIISKQDKLDNWFYGHFHISETNYIDSTKFVALDRARPLETPKYKLYEYLTY